MQAVSPVPPPAILPALRVSTNISQAANCTAPSSEASLSVCFSPASGSPWPESMLKDPHKNRVQEGLESEEEFNHASTQGLPFFHFRLTESHETRHNRVLKSGRTGTRDRDRNSFCCETLSVFFSFRLRIPALDHGS